MQEDQLYLVSWHFWLADIRSIIDDDDSLQISVRNQPSLTLSLVKMSRIWLHVKILVQTTSKNFILILSDSRETWNSRWEQNNNNWESHVKNATTTTKTRNQNTWMLKIKRKMRREDFQFRKNCFNASKRIFVMRF